MIPIEPAPIEVVQYVTDYELNVMAQRGTQKFAPWGWKEYGCEGTRWFGPPPCRDSQAREKRRRTSLYFYLGF